MVGNEAADGCRNAKGAELCGVFGILVEAKKVDVSKITFDALWKLVLVDEIKIKWRSGLIMGIGHLTRDVKRSIESVFMSAPLFLAAWRIVLEMSPGRENGWDGVDGVVQGWFRGGTGSV